MSTTIEGIAIGLIEALGAGNTREHVAGVVQILEGVIQGVHCQWEQHLAKQTNELLCMDIALCKNCGNKMTVKRERTYIELGEQ